MNAVMECAEQRGRQPRAAAVANLVAVAGGRRAVLEESRDAFIDRLHRTSDDYDATNALALVYAAINAVDAQNLPVRPRSKRGQRSARRSRTTRR